MPRAACRAGRGRGKDDPRPGEEARAELRRLGHQWLTDELSAWKRIAFTAGSGNGALVAKTLAYWKQDSDLAGVREEQELVKLPDSERPLWKTLWADVDDLLAGVQAK